MRTIWWRTTDVSEKPDTNFAKFKSQIIRKSLLPNGVKVFGAYCESKKGKYLFL